MATLNIVNPNPSLIGDITFTPPPTEAWERLSEQISELNEDADRAGFGNWGSGDTHLIKFGLTGSPPSSTYTNMQAGNDILTLQNTGDDVAYMGSGNDKVYAGIGWDTVYGGSGNDTLYGEAGNDTLYGGSGADELRGGADADKLYGGTGVDVIYGGTGNDVLDGGADADTLYGDSDGATLLTSGNDTLNGGFGNDWLYGEAGNDTLNGGADSDWLMGGSGTDTLIGGAGEDMMYGGTGADTFVFLSDGDFGTGHGDFIKDFCHTEGDRIDLRGVDANTTLAGNQAFRLVSGPSETAGDMWLSGGDGTRQFVQLNIDGVSDGVHLADFRIVVDFNDPAITTLTAADFFL